MIPSWYQVRTSASKLAAPAAFYHGTCSEHLPQILFEGLRNPHLCDSWQRAFYWAEEASYQDGGKSIVIAIPAGRVDQSKLRMDYVAMDEPVNALESDRDEAWETASEEHPEWVSDGMISIPPSEWRWSWDAVGAARYDGIVRVESKDVVGPKQSPLQASDRGLVRTAGSDPGKEPWQMTRNEFTDFHDTGFIPSHAYEKYRTLEGMNWLGKRDKYPILHSKGVFGSKKIEFRQSGEKLKYVKTTDEPDEYGLPAIVRDKSGLAVMMSDEEMDLKGLPKLDTTIVAFDGDTPVGWVSDEFGTMGVWVAEPYQKLGIGTHLAREFYRTFPGRKMGQMTNAGRNVSMALHRKLVEEAVEEGKPVPNNVLAEYPGLAREPSIKTAAASPQDWFREFSVRITGTDPKTYKDYDMEVMVHVDQDYRPIRAYTYADEARNLDRKYKSPGKGLNPLFVHLNGWFIHDFLEEIEEQVSEDVRQEAEPPHPGYNPGEQQEPK